MAVNVQAKLNFGNFGTKAVSKPVKKAAKQVSKQVKKAAPAKPAQAVRKAGSQLKRAAAPTGSRGGGVGYRKYDTDALWLPNTQRPEWLDGSLPGDRGFDPLGLAKPTEYLQVEIDQLDQNAAVNKAGQLIGQYSQTRKEKVSKTDSLQPYDDVFGIERFRECELIHGRWAMLACLGCIVAEATTGVSWVEAGKVELDGAQYFNQSLPFSISTLCWIEAFAVGGAEIYRNSETDLDKRCYPGGIFDPLQLASSDPRQARRLKESELRHCRLAMVAFLGYSVQALAFGEGALGSLAYFTKNFA